MSKDAFNKICIQQPGEKFTKYTLNFYKVFILSENTTNPKK